MDSKTHPDNNCYYCGRKVVWIPEQDAQNRNREDRKTLDHVVPKVKGGHGRFSNIVVACKKCNGDKGQLSLAEFRIVLDYRKGLVRRPFVLKDVIRPVQIACLIVLVALHQMWLKTGLIG